MRVELIHAAEAGVTRLVIEVAEGTTLQQAIRLSGVLERHPALDPSCVLHASVHGERRRPDARLEEGDRIELCRPLRVDPKEARRRRAGKRP